MTSFLEEDQNGLHQQWLQRQSRVQGNYIFMCWWKHHLPSDLMSAWTLQDLNSIIVELSTVVFTIAFEVGQGLNDLSESISLCACLYVSLIKNTNWMTYNGSYLIYMNARRLGARSWQDGFHLFCASPCFLRVCPACLAFFNLKLRHPILCVHLHKVFFPCLSVSKFPLFRRKNITRNGLRVHPTSPWPHLNWLTQ